MLLLLKVVVVIWRKRSVNKKFCCEGFQFLTDNYADTGLSALVVEAESGLEFNLQSRGVSFLEQDRIPHIDVKVNLSSRVGLKYCPFCGAFLKDFLDKNIDFYSSLAKRHSSIDS